MNDLAAWERWRRLSADPVVIDRDGNRWSASDWDWIHHRPLPGRTPRSP